MRRFIKGSRTRGRPQAAAPRRMSLEPLESRTLFALSPVALFSVSDACKPEPAIPMASTGVARGLEQSAATAEVTQTPVAASPLSSLPRLSSNPAAIAKVFLDFDGHFESMWGAATNVSTPAYDRDGDRTTFSDTELTAIRETWTRVAEDFAPFNIDVTTIDPGTTANRVAATIAIGGNSSDWFGAAAGGVAYVGGFYNSAPNVGFVFEDNLSNGDPKFVAEAATHEAGHLFGLSHQATWNGSTLTQEYNPGNPAWAPIMGVGYYSLRTTWHNGPSIYGSTFFQDDLSILAGANNGFGYRTDDYGDSVTAASLLPVSGGSVNFAGLIGRPGDADVWSFNTIGGQVSLQLAVTAPGANLDAVLELRNAAGQTMVTAAPTDSLGASISTTVGAGTYFLVARTSGDYGNLGQYTITGLVPATVTVSTTQIIDNGDAGFSTTGSWIPYAGQGFQSDVHYMAAGIGSNTARWTAVVTPGQYEVAVSWSPYVNRATNAPFGVLDGAVSLGTTAVNQQLAPVDFADQGAGWKTLGTFSIAGNSLTVSLDDNANLYVIADAVRIQRVGDLPTTPPPQPPPPPPPLTTQIIDNGNAGFTTTGAWLPYGAQGYQNDVHYLPAGFGANTARWTASVTPGLYQVALTWSPYWNRATNAPFTVLDGGASLGTTPVNQQLAPADFADQGTSWKTLGTFAITGNSLAVLLGDNANWHVIADAVRIQRVGDLPAAVQFVNDADSGFSTTGSWVPFAGQGYQSEVHYAAAGSGSSGARWTAAVTPGQYQVAVTWSPHSNRATDAPFSVWDDSVNLGETAVNQQLAPTDFLDQGTSWKSLGTFIVTGNMLTVLLGDDADGYVIADATRILRVGDLSAVGDLGGGHIHHDHDSALDSLLDEWELEVLPLPRKFC
jgi:hypothetical protein